MAKTKQQLLSGGYGGSGTVENLRRAFDRGFLTRQDYFRKEDYEKAKKAEFFRLGHRRARQEGALDKKARAKNIATHKKYLTKLKKIGHRLSAGQQKDYTKLFPSYKQPIGTYDAKTGILMTKAGGVSTAFPNGKPPSTTMNWVRGTALQGYAKAMQNYSNLLFYKSSKTPSLQKSQAFSVPSNVKNSLFLNLLYKQAKTPEQRSQVNRIASSQSYLKQLTPTTRPQTLTAKQAIQQANKVVQAAKTASISRKYVQPTISGVGKGKKISQTEREKLIEVVTTPYLTTLLKQPAIPAIREEINKLSNSTAKTITVALKSGRKISYPVFTTIDKAGRSFVQIGITIGDVILSKLSAKDKQYLFKQIFEKNTSGSKALSQLFKPVILKQTSKKEVEAKLRALGGTAAQILAVTAVGGGTGILLRGLSMATSDNPTEILASLAMGGVFGGGGVVLEKGSRLVKAFLGTSKLGKVYLFAKASSGRIIPLYFAYETIGSVGSVLSATSVASERAVGRSLAGSFAAFGFGVKAGEKIASRLTRPIQNAIWVKLFEKKLSKEYGKNSKEYRQGIKEVQAIFGSMKRANQVLSPYDARFVESISASPKAWKIVNKVLRQNAGDFVILGSGAIVPQTGLKRPPRGKLGDIDANSLTGSTGAKRIATQLYTALRKGGYTKKQVSIRKSMFQGEPKYHVSFRLKGKGKFGELLNISSSIKFTKYQIGEIGSILDLPTRFAFNKDKFGVKLLNLRDQMRSKVKGYVEGRGKDLKDILGLTPKFMRTITGNNKTKANSLIRAFNKARTTQRKKDLLKQFKKLLEELKKVKAKIYKTKPPAKKGYVIVKKKYASGKTKGYSYRKKVSYKYKPVKRVTPYKYKPTKKPKLYSYKPPAKKGYVIYKVKYKSGRTKGYRYRPIKYKKPKYKTPKYKKPKYRKPLYKKTPYKKPPYKPSVKKPPYKPPYKKLPYKIPSKKPPIFLPSQNFQGNINRLSKNKRPVDLYIRKRVKGKLKPVLIKRNLFPKQATALGRHITNNTIARTYIIKISKKGRPRKIIIPKSVATKRYRSPKGKTQLQLGSRVERSKFLLDTKKEKQQINSAKRRTPKRRIKRKKPIKRKKRKVSKRKKKR